MLKVFGHGGHNPYSYLIDDRNQLEKFLDNEWYIVIPAYILALALVGGVVYLVSKKSMSAVYFTLLGIFLVVGLMGYSQSPELSIFSITAGFALAFVVIFGGVLNKK